MNSRAIARFGIETPRERIAAGAAAMFRYAVMGFVIAISVLPLVWVVISSLETNSEILSSALNLPAQPSLKGYATAFRFARLDLKFITSLIVAASTTALSLLIYSLAAYALSRFRFRLRTLVFTLLISSILIPVNTMVQPVYEMVLRLGLYDTKAALILVYTGFSMPLCLFVLRSYMMHLPYGMEESAYLEGASVPHLLADHAAAHPAGAGQLGGAHLPRIVERAAVRAPAHLLGAQPHPAAGDALLHAAVHLRLLGHVRRPGDLRGAVDHPLHRAAEADHVRRRRRRHQRVTADAVPSKLN